MAVSPVYPVTTATPSLTATVYAILVGALGYVNLSPAALDAPVSTSVGSADLDQTDARYVTSQGQFAAPSKNDQDTAQEDGRMGAGPSSLTVSPAGLRCRMSFPDTLPQLVEGPEFPCDLFIVIDSLQESSWSCPPKNLSLQELKSCIPLRMLSSPMAFLARRLSKSSESFETRSLEAHHSSDTTSGLGSSITRLGQSSRLSSSGSSTNLTPGYLPLSHALSGGSTATVFKVHGLDLVCKVFGPGEGAADDRYEGDWLADFHCEAFAYNKLLRDLQGTAIPRCYGVYKSPAASMAVLVLEHSGNPIPHASISHELFRKQDE